MSERTNLAHLTIPQARSLLNEVALHGGVQDLYVWIQALVLMETNDCTGLSSPEKIDAYEQFERLTTFFDTAQYDVAVFALLLAEALWRDGESLAEVHESISEYDIDELVGELAEKITDIVKAELRCRLLWDESG